MSKKESLQDSDSDTCRDDKKTGGRFSLGETRMDRIRNEGDSSDQVVWRQS